MSRQSADLFPLVVREIDDPKLLVVFQSYENLVRELEYPDVVNDEYIAWDRFERRVRVWSNARGPIGDWITLSLVAASDDRSGLFETIRQFAEVNGIIPQFSPGERGCDALKRLQQERHGES